MWMQSTSQMIAWNNNVGKKMSFWCSTAWAPNQTWTECNDLGWNIKSIVDNAYANDAEPVILWSINPNLPANVQYNKNITDGVWDSYLHELARNMAADGRIIHFRMFWEMNAYGYEGGGWGGRWSAKWYATADDAYNDRNPINTPTTFKNMWRHVVDIFKDEGAYNVKFWFTVGPVPPSGYENAFGSIPLADIYPGDYYVDYLGYEFYTKPGEYITALRIRSTYQELADLNPVKPIVIAEAGIFTDDNAYASKWWREALDPTYIKMLYPRTSGILIWNADMSDGCGFTTESLRAQAVESFKVAPYKNGA
jgi:beta-mannanase